MQISYIVRFLYTPLPDNDILTLMQSSRRQRHPHTSRLVGNETGLSWLHRIFVLDTTSAMPAHWHAHADIEVICRFNGSQRYQFADHGDVVLKPRQVLIIPARCRHCLANDIDTPGKRICLFFRRPRGAAASRDAVFTARNLEFFYSQLLANAFRPLMCDNFTFRAFSELAVLARKRRMRALEHWELACARALTCSALMRLAILPKPSQEDTAQLMARAVDWLDKRIAEKVRMSDLVSFIGYGQSRFFQLFKQHTGHTPADWLTRQRMSRAQKLLVTTADSAAAIGRSVGLGNPAYFTAAFRKATGLTPSAYRAKFARHSLRNRAQPFESRRNPR